MSFDKSKSLLTVCDDLTQVKGNVSQFQAMVNNIISKAPTREEYEKLLKTIRLGEAPGETKQTMKTRAIDNCPANKIAVRLKELFLAGYLPLLTSLSKINFKSNIEDQFVSYFMDYNPVLPSNVVQDLRVLQGKKADPSRHLLISFPILQHCLINSTILLLRIMTDRSHKLMAPIILTKFAFGYNLVDHLKYNVSVDADYEEKLQIIGNIFLAYMGGLKTEGYDLSDLKLFVKRLYEPVIADYMNKNDVLSKVALVELDLLFKSITNLLYLPRENIRYEIIQVESDPHVARILVDNEELGSGVSSVSFEEAKCRAAQDILNDHNRIRKIWEILKNNHTKNNITETTTTTTTIKTEKPETIMQIPIQQAPPTMNSHIGTPVVEQATANIASVNAGSPPMQNHTAAISPSLANATVRQTSPQFTMQPPSQQQQQQPFAFAQPQRYPGVAYQTPFLQQQQPQPYVNSPTDISSMQQQNPHAQQATAHSPPPQLSQQPQPQSQAQPPSNGGPLYDQPSTSMNSEQIYNVDTNARNDLYSKLGKAKIATPEYEDKISPEKVYHVLVSAKGIYLGGGYDLNKKLAAQKAAMCALANKVKLSELGLYS
ncbi:putative nucleic acid-binding region family protein [Candida albicans]|uniref:Putative nucleic acid-binding region family protein n=1 Tax=Candida albicans TaxID=5476 RepID=A0A8H6C4U8_CANAX|nr:putative nucleic acid-binding region family protein [Candida albicans]